MFAGDPFDIRGVEPGVDPVLFFSAFESQLLQPISQVSGHFVEILKSDEANGARIKKYQNHTPSIIRRLSDNVSFLKIKGPNEINTSQRYTHH